MAAVHGIARGKYLAGFVPASVVSKVTRGL